MSLRELIEQMQSAPRPRGAISPRDPYEIATRGGTRKREELAEVDHIPPSWIVGVHVMERGDD